MAEELLAPRRAVRVEQEDERDHDHEAGRGDRRGDDGRGQHDDRDVRSNGAAKCEDDRSGEAGDEEG